MWLTLPAGLEEWLSKRVEIEVADSAGVEEAVDKGSWLAQGLHGVEHLLTSVMPLLVMCDRRDIDGYHQFRGAELDAPAVFVYDSYEGGIGLAEIAFQRIAELVQLAYDTVVRCPCSEGCPSCIQSGSCRQRNETLHKGAARAILELLVRKSEAVTGIRAWDGLSAEALVGPGQIASGPDTSRKRALQDLLARTRQQGIHQRIAANDKAEPSTPEQSSFARGDQIECSLYGRGTVLSSRLEGQRQVVTVRFAHRSLVKEVEASRCTVAKRENNG